MFEEHLRGTPEKLARLGELNGKTLGCYCKLNQPCHVDVILKVMRERGFEVDLRQEKSGLPFGSRKSGP